MTTRVQDTAHLNRIYFDTSAFNALLRHRSREMLIPALRGSGNAVLASVINAAELLNSKDEALRTNLCKMASRAHAYGLVMLDHPMNILKHAAEAVRRGDVSISLSEKGPVAEFHALLDRPLKMTNTDAAHVRAWVAEMKSNLDDFRSRLDISLRESPLPRIAAAELIADPAFANLLYRNFEELKDIVGSADELHDFILRSDVWAAYAATVAYEFKVAEGVLSKRGRMRLPGGPDLRQAVYLGLVQTFVVRDEGLRLAAEWISTQLPSRRRIVEADRFFSKLSSPWINR